MSSRLDLGHLASTPRELRAVRSSRTHGFARGYGHYTSTSRLNTPRTSGPVAIVVLSDRRAAWQRRSSLDDFEFWLDRSCRSTGGRFLHLSNLIELPLLLARYHACLRIVLVRHSTVFLGWFWTLAIKYRAFRWFIVKHSSTHLSLAAMSRPSALRVLFLNLVAVVPYLALVSALGSKCTTPLGGGSAAAGDPYWLESVKHQGIAAFNTAPSTYQVFRNVKVCFMRF